MNKNHEGLNLDRAFDRLFSDRGAVGTFLTGHLAVEAALLNLIAEKKPEQTSKAEKLTHSKLIGLCRKCSLLSESQEKALKAINRVRNCFAHDLAYEPHPSEIHALFELARDAFTDMTDGLEQGLEAYANAKHRHDGLFALPELFSQICYDLWPDDDWMDQATTPAVHPSD